jgi:sugar/nucleoside kinase (ribokinase family)
MYFCSQYSADIANSCLVFADCNPSQSALEMFLALSAAGRTPIIINTVFSFAQTAQKQQQQKKNIVILTHTHYGTMSQVSVAKCERVCSRDMLAKIDIITPNMLELIEMTNILSGNKRNLNPESEFLSKKFWLYIQCSPLFLFFFSSFFADISEVQANSLVEELLAAGVRHVVVTHGANGVIHGVVENGSPNIQAFAALQPRAIVSTNGCGDAFVGGLLAALSANLNSNFKVDLTTRNIRSAILVGLEAAKLTIEQIEIAPAKAFSQLRAKFIHKSAL